MAIVYNKEHGFQSILNVALGAYHTKSFHLVELDDHTLYPYYRDERIAVLSQGRATIPVIQETCRQHLESLAG